MNLGALKAIGAGLTVLGAVLNVAVGIVDQKTMVAEVTKQVAEALAKK